jgi:hypothetical protein
MTTTGTRRPDFALFDMLTHASFQFGPVAPDISAKLYFPNSAIEKSTTGFQDHDIGGVALAERALGAAHRGVHFRLNPIFKEP